MSNYQQLHYSPEHFLAYRKLSSADKLEKQFLQADRDINNEPGIIFLGGFKSDMNGTKAQAIAEHARANNYNFISFDYFGHGQSSGQFIDGTIGIWLENCLTIIDQLTDNKPQILIGSSMGGWLMLLAALMRPNKIAGLIGLAAAPDFTEDLIWHKMTDKQKSELLQTKQIDFHNEFCEDAYPISYHLIEEARRHLLLKDKINLDMSIRLVHGMLDQDVPYHTSIKIAELVTGQDVQTILLKNAGHRLSSAHELALIYELIDEMLYKATII